MSLRNSVQWLIYMVDLGHINGSMAPHPAEVYHIWADDRTWSGQNWQSYRPADFTLRSENGRRYQEVTSLRLVYLAAIFPNIGQIIHV